MTAPAATGTGGEAATGSETGPLVAAFLVALLLHAAALLALASWRTPRETPPGEQSITIDLAPQMVEAPSVEPTETSQPAGEPTEVAASEPPTETAASEPPPAETAPPPEAAQAETAPPEAQPVEVATAEDVPAQPATPDAVLPPDAQPIESASVEAMPLPPAVPPAPKPVTTAKSAAKAKPVAKPVAKPIAKPKAPEPVERKVAARPTQTVRTRETAPSESARSVRQAARPGAGGQSQSQAARGASSREDTGGSAAAAADPSALSRYVAQLAAALKSRLRYPEAARAAGASGTATLRFTLHRSGRVVSATLVRSAGHPALDGAALATASPGSSLPPAPDGVPQAQLTVSVPLRFNVQ